MHDSVYIGGKEGGGGLKVVLQPFRGVKSLTLSQSATFYPQGITVQFVSKPGGKKWRGGGGVKSRGGGGRVVKICITMLLC